MQQQADELVKESKGKSSTIVQLERKLDELQAQQSMKGTPEQNQRIRGLELKVEEMATGQAQREKRQEAEMSKKEALYKQQIQRL